MTNEIKLTAPNNGGKVDDYPDLVTETFDRKTGSTPMIEFSDLWWAREAEDRVNYLHKLASSLDDAAKKLQKENNEMNELLFKKEAQLDAAHKAMGTDRSMIQKQLINENAKQQKLLEENQALRAEIKALEARLEA